MYKGIEIIRYDIIDSLILDDMYWDNLNGSNYLERVFSLIDKHFSIDIIFKFHLKNLLSLILENVHDHGSCSCILNIGKLNSYMVIEAFEPSGGFDLKKLPHGKGKCGFREMKRSKCLISHSPDGKQTFIIIPTQKKIIKRMQN